MYSGSHQRSPVAKSPLSGDRLFPLNQAAIKRRIVTDESPTARRSQVSLLSLCELRPLHPCVHHFASSVSDPRTPSLRRPFRFPSCLAPCFSTISICMPPAVSDPVMVVRVSRIIHSYRVP